MPPLSPLRPVEFFGRTWEGEGEWTPRRWAALLPQPRRLHFRSWTTLLTEETWLVHDETVWADGSVQRRDGIATLVGADRVRFTYDDMPGGTEVTLRAGGYSLAPYRMAVPVPLLPILVLVSCRDECVLATDGTLVDTIELSIMGGPLGRQVMRLRPA